jgi:DNA-directed RNA polymerase specialized sigma24 family protein
VITAALAARITAEIGTLSELDQDIFRLCATEGYAYQAAAAELGVSHAVVRNRLSRVRTQLRETVNESRDA